MFMCMHAILYIDLYVHVNVHACTWTVYTSMYMHMHVHVHYTCPCPCVCFGQYHVLVNVLQYVSLCTDLLEGCGLEEQCPVGVV